MPSYTFAPPIAVTDPSRVDAWLQAKGYTLLDGSSIHADGTVTVVTDRDPSADVAAYADAPTPAQQQTSAAVAAVRAYVAAVRAIPAASRTPEQRVLLAMALLIRDLAQATS